MSFHRRASEVCGAGLRPHQTLFWSTSDFEKFELVAADLSETASADPCGSL